MRRAIAVVLDNLLYINLKPAIGAVTSTDRTGVGQGDLVTAGVPVTAVLRTRSVRQVRNPTLLAPVPGTQSTSAHRRLGTKLYRARLDAIRIRPRPPMVSTV